MYWGPHRLFFGLDILRLSQLKLKLDLSLNTSQDDALNTSEDYVQIAQAISSNVNHNISFVFQLLSIASLYTVSRTLFE